MLNDNEIISLISEIQNELVLSRGSDPMIAFPAMERASAKLAQLKETVKEGGNVK